MRLKGDTLIEVALAIGVFSLVAITVVSVTSVATSKAQSALEITVTREELDAQAEALRFIHDSYVSGSQGKENKLSNDYEALWEAVTDRAVSASDATEKGFLEYNPVSCSDLYNSGQGLKTEEADFKPFVINIRELGNPANVDKILIKNEGRDGESLFFPASTYPRIIYKNSTVSVDQEGDTQGLDADFHSQIMFDSRSEISRIEGIYILAVEDKHQIVSDGFSEGGIKVESKDAYFDFYIRSCWMPPGTDHASTISTVVRLYDPSEICYANCPTTENNE